jgi:hypothetical protein
VQTLRSRAQTASVLLALCAVAGGRARAQADSQAQAHAQAQPTVHVQIEVLASCPSGGLLREQLAPLLAPGTVLAVNTDAPPAGAIAATVRDLGDRYLVALGGVQRELDDPGRTCVERARVAAVFIALNGQPRAGATPGAPGSDGDGAGEDAFLRLALELFAAAAYASEIDRAAPGGGAGVWLELAALRFGFHAALLAPAEVSLDVVQGVSGNVALLRVPLIVSAGYLWTTGGLQLGPSLGLELDVLRLRGQDVASPETELRLNPGAVLSADLRAPLGRALSAVLRLSLSAFPRAYRLKVDPTGSLGETPHLWFGAALGLGWQL